MKLLLPIHIWPIYRLLKLGVRLRVPEPLVLQLRVVVAVVQEAINGPNIDWQDEFHRGILRGLRNISETP